MKTFLKPVFVLFLLPLFVVSSSASPSAKDDQVTFPEIGKKCPDIIFDNVSYFSKKRVSLRDFKGKWVVLDFWNRLCGACISSFPKTNMLQKEFKGEVQFLLVGYTGSQFYNVRDDGKIQKLYDKFKSVEKLDLPIAYDSVYFHKFDIASCPYIIVIDNDGIVRAITYEISSKKIHYLLDNKTANLTKDAFRRHEDPPLNAFHFDGDKPFLINKNGGNDTSFLYRSVIAQWDESMPYYIDDLDMRIAAEKSKFQLSGISLSRLLNYAVWGEDSWTFEDTLYGKVYPKPLLENSDRTTFDKDKNFSYSLIVKQRPNQQNFSLFKKIMLGDLKNYFGFDISIENRSVNYFKLVVVGTNYNNLLAKSDSTYTRRLPHFGYMSKNTPVRNLLSFIASENYGDIFIDETGITRNIDIKISCVVSNIDDLRKALNVYGLDLISAKREMKVMVIRDSNPN